MRTLIGTMALSGGHVGLDGHSLCEGRLRVGHQHRPFAVGPLIAAFISPLTLGNHPAEGAVVCIGLVKPTPV